MATQGMTLSYDYDCGSEQWYYSRVWNGLLLYSPQIASEAAGQGVTITGEKHRNTWDWVNSVVFAATIVTTIGLYVQAWHAA